MYEPEKVRRPLLHATGYMGIIFAAMLWRNADKFGLDIPTLFIITGIALFNVILQIIDKRRCNENYKTAVMLKKQRDEMTPADFVENKDDYYF